jgi:epoxyqueuosine reductase
MIMPMEQVGEKDKLSATWTNLLEKYSFQDARWISYHRPLTIEAYKAWLEKDLHGDMSYMKEHLPWKEDLRSQKPEIQSVIMVTCHYYPAKKITEKFSSELESTRLRQASYSQAPDYHLWFYEALGKFANDLQKVIPDALFFPATDSAPFLERDFARQAGLGWVGKNTCLIHPENGSFFFIGEILSTAQAPEASVQLMHDFCGNCRRCIDSCPTQALQDDRILDARRCISYLTIESQKIPPQNLRKGIGDWFFGCDICQTVCPWNEKLLRKNPEWPPFRNETLLSLSDHERQSWVNDLTEILSSSNKVLMKKWKNSALARARGFGLKRNALIVAANQKLVELVPLITEYLQHDRLSELAKWSLDEIQKQD